MSAKADWVYALGRDATRLGRLDEAKDLLANDPELDSLVAVLPAVYEAARGLDPKDIIGPMITPEAQGRALAALALFLHDYLQQRAIRAENPHAANPLASNPNMTIHNEEIEQAMGAIGQTVAKALPAGWGFMLNIFSFGPNGATFYMSNAQRADMVSNMRELADKIEKGEA